MEKDPIRSSDSFDAFEEIFQIAREKDVLIIECTMDSCARSILYSLVETCFMKTSLRVRHCFARWISFANIVSVIDL